VPAKAYQGVNFTFTNRIRIVTHRILLMCVISPSDVCVFKNINIHHTEEVDISIKCLHVCVMYEYVQDLEAV
jgi:hypothetical protein